MTSYVADDQYIPKDISVASMRGHARQIARGRKTVSQALYILGKLTYACVSAMTAIAIIAIIAIIAKNHPRPGKEGGRWQENRKRELD